VDNAFPSLELLATMDHATYVQHFAGTAVTRARRRGLARNAAIALGNSGDARAEPLLRKMLLEHDEPLARGHAAWGLAQLLGVPARSYLERCQTRETSPLVIDEIRFALREVLA
jgi:epoxyqueuosine reductase